MSCPQQPHINHTHARTSHDTMSKWFSPRCQPELSPRCQCITCSPSTPPITADWLVGWLLNPKPHVGIGTCWHQAACLLKTWPCINIVTICVQSSLFSLQSSERDLAGGGGRCWGKQSVGWQSEDKGRMDRCCCQDLSAVTNGCCKDEASKTLENSDVVNHRYECVCVCVCGCVCFICACLCALVTVWVNERESVCALAYRCVPSCKVPTLTAALQDGRVLGNWFRWCLRATEMNLCVWLQEKNSKHHEIEMAEQRIPGGKGSQRQGQEDSGKNTQFWRNALSVT